MMLVRRYFICAVLCAVLWNSSRTHRVSRAVMHDARPWLFIFAVLSAVCGQVLGTPPCMTAVRREVNRDTQGHLQNTQT